MVNNYQQSSLSHDKYVHESYAIPNVTYSKEEHGTRTIIGDSFLRYFDERAK